MKTDLKNLTQKQLCNFVEAHGQPRFRGRQLLAWIYRPGPPPFQAMTDLAKEFRSFLENRARISCFSGPRIAASRDGTVKFAFTLEDNRVIESVLIPEEDRYTLCVSTQAGCGMGCRFCMTGLLGLQRNLTTAEILNQVCYVRDWLLARDRPSLTNLVFMGMGEPLANLDNLLAAIDLLTEQRGLDFSARRITVSTCGLIPPMQVLAANTQVNIAVSLHAADDTTRSRLMPVNRVYPLAQLLDSCRKLPLKKRQRIMFAYTLLAGINDDDQTARRLAELLRGFKCKINLLAMSPVQGLDYCSPGRERMLAFQRILRQQGYTVFIRQSRGADIAAACGQLAGR